MALTTAEANTIENRFLAIEAAINDLQVAVNKLPTKQQLIQLLSIRQKEIDDLSNEVETLSITGGTETSELPDLAGILGSVLIEDPIGTLIFRKLIEDDIQDTFAISTFTATTSVIEVGQTAATPAMTATYNRTPSSVVLTDDEGSGAKDVTSTPTSFTASFSGNKTANNDSVQFTLTANEGGPSDVSTTTISWRPRTYWDVGVDGLSSEADIEALSNSQLDNNRNTSFTLNPGVAEYIYYAFPSAYGTPTFTISGFEGGFVLEASAVSVTNAYGVTQNYDLWKSINPNLGSTTVVIT